MINAIVEILKERIGELPYIERYAGLVRPVVKPQFVDTMDDNNIPRRIFLANQVWPVACSVSGVEKCGDANSLKILCPDSSLASVLFFTDTTGARMVRTTAPKRGALQFEFGVKLLCWLNLPKLGVQGDCDFAGRLVAHLIGKIYGSQQSNTLADYWGDVLRNVDVVSVSELPKSPDLFSPFEYAKIGAEKGLFVLPYDYFALQVNGTFTVDPKCVPVPTFEIVDTQICLPE